MYFIDTKSKVALHKQLYKQIKKDIIENYSVGQKLPSIRKLANTYNLSKTSVENAYSQLVAEGFIESIPKSGYEVVNWNYNEFNFEKEKKELELEEKKQEYLYDFFPARLEKDSFPLKLWKRLFNKVINESIDFGMYQEGQGNFTLREQISKYLIESRGVNCNANQIIVCNGFADSMGLLARLVKEDYKSLAIENPGYYIARKVFESFDFQIDKITVNKDGIDLKQLENSSSKMVYITPSHQYPFGVAMPIANRLKILNWAKENDALIIEDDYDSELSYVNRPIPSLQGLDNFDRVVYVGTFSKALSPAIRVSFLVLPSFLIKKYKQSYEARTSRVCISTQKVLEEFIKEGFWDRHLRKIRTLNKKKHNLMKKLLKEKLGDTFKIESQGGGLAILINPNLDFDWKKFEEEAKKEKIKIHLAKPRVGGDWQGIMMGFGGFKENELENALELFTKVWRKAIIQKI